MAVRKVVERFLRLFVLTQGRAEIIWNDEWFLFFGLRTFLLNAHFVQANGLFDVAQKNSVGREIGQSRDTAKVAHAVVVGVFAQDEFAFPKTEGAMRLKSSHAAHHAFVQKVRKSPFQSFLDVGAAGVDKLSQMIEDGLGEGSGVHDVTIDLRIFHRCGEEIAGG